MPQDCPGYIDQSQPNVGESAKVSSKSISLGFEGNNENPKNKLFVFFFGG
jgi:hypothetical protein